MLEVLKFEEYLKESQEHRIDTSSVDPELVQKASQGNEEAFHALAKGVYSRSFEMDSNNTSHLLKPVDLSTMIEGDKEHKINKIMDFLKKYGFTARFFTSHPDDVGVNCLGHKIEKKPFNLKKHGYESGNVWIYNPCDSHGSFDDNMTTFLWRIVHEMAHGITEELMHKKYGPSRRFGAMNFDIHNPYDASDKRVYKGLTLKESQRAVEWEDVAFKAQEILFKELGLKIPKENHILDFNIAGHDVVVRLLTGDFSDPGAVGILPNANKKVSVKDVLTFIENQYKANAKYLNQNMEDGIDLNRWKPYSVSEVKAQISKFMASSDMEKLKIMENYFNGYGVDEVFKNGLTGINIKSKVIDIGHDCVSDGKVIKKLEHGLILKQCKDVFIFEKDGVMVYVQEYALKNEVLYFKSRQKFDDTIKNLFVKMVVELLSTNKYKYIQDDDTHTHDSVMAMNNLINDGRIEFKIYDRIKHTEDVIQIAYQLTHLIWKDEIDIRYYPTSNTKVDEKIIKKMYESYETVPTLDGLLYGISANSSYGSVKDKD